jgi:hypothetical protein
MAEKGFGLCIRYNARVDLENQRLKAFEMHFANCSSCGEKVMLSGETWKLIDSNRDLQPVCQICAPVAVGNERPQLMMTGGQMSEAAALLEKLKAKNN